ncbi:hypothetical protein M2222_008284 [Bradyrhizobium elkanii]|uniref:hypothetical protein n=1 Tax=Bradyrhizobium elkanii TaxID=29448 RepID=UPI00216997AD|nr:hypothetical protein [Bradyrhizobium elkanii]MCS3451939.1 hypothetical protein [Bradyrhizobium elkanii]MCS3565962.1 hypothetical protein [Bradyrhizobium elkanii]MCW2153308.1 hypothetical protein [Bradyrhizobium elkanii]MCW2377041.1 hypothetical protein [Bradyrhizobium elkanii]
MSEMQERVVGAMEKRRAELINQPLARIWPELAVAAIEAMREPTEVMISAAFAADGTNMPLALGYDDAYRAMIDAVLSGARHAG